MERDLANIAIYRGQLAAAERILREASRAHINDSLSGDLAFNQVATLHHQAQLRLEWDPEGALPLITEAVRLIQRTQPDQYWICRPLQVMILDRSGKFEQTDSLLTWLENRSKDSGIGLGVFHYTTALSKLERGETEAAVAALTPLAASTARADDFAVHFHLARAQLAAGRLAEAVAGFEHLMSVYSASRLEECVWNIRMYYYLGRAYEASRWPDKAKAQYEMFLSYWGSPDVPLAEVTDARQRLAHLKEGS
jgi:tetratricopeptide (TPR) repeat protein